MAFDVTQDRGYPYSASLRTPGEGDAPGALQRYRGVYEPYSYFWDSTGGQGDTFHDPTDPTRDNPATTQPFGDMLRDTIAVGRDLVGAPNWGTALGTAASMATGLPGLGSIVGTGVNTLGVSDSARAGTFDRHFGSGVPSQQLAGALAQAAAAGRYGLSAPMEGSWLGMFDSKPSNDSWAGLGGTKSDQLGADYSGGNYGGSMDKGSSPGGPNDGRDKGGTGANDPAWMARGGHVGALRRARRR